MLKFDTIEMREIRLPLKQPFVTASGIQDCRRILLLEISARTGETAWSECVAQETPHYSPETIDTAWFAIREWFVPALKGHDISAPSDILVPLRAFRGHRMAKAALEMACWNLEAQRMKTSLAVLLGGTQRHVPAGIAIGMQPEESMLVERVRNSLGQGYQNVKIKIGPGADVRYVEAIRSEIGADVPLSVDANASYTLADIELLRTLDAYGLTMIEQPLAQDDLVRHAVLQEQLSTPVCLDESITGPDRAEDMVRLRSGRVVNVKPGRVGGLSAAISVHNVCRKGRLNAWVGGMLETGIGRAYNVALASLPGFTLPGDLSPSSRYWACDIVQPEWTMSPDGFVEVPLDRAGLGVEIDRDRIDHLTCRLERLVL